MTRIFKASIALASLALAACAGMPEEPATDYVAVYPPVWSEQHSGNGAIFQPTTHYALFEDIKARRVGDILTVHLVEQTSGSKSTGSSINKSSSTSVTDPILAGRTRSFGDENTLAFNLGSEQDFSGGSGSSQSNRLTGSITVMVAAVLPNGNLVIQGEKWLRINQGDEYIRLRGIVRAIDVGNDNTVLSTQIADARISYGGTGAGNDANEPGWLSRFFLNPIWPF